MKRVLLFSYILCALPFLVSCENELVTPAGATNSQTKEAYGACRTYQYITKTGEATSYGVAYKDILLVGFRESITAREKQQIVRQSPLYKEIVGEVALDSGPITVVQLKARSTCADVEYLRAQLQRHPDVLFANPAFNAQDSEIAWIGLPNEFLVSIETGTQAQLEALVASTNTRLVFSLSEELHLMSADKNSQGDALAMSNLFNQQAFVLSAEPNFIFQAKASGTGEAATQTTLKKNK
jgi:predicted TIM-barrel fold metal-dependent hydrolase